MGSELEETLGGEMVYAIKTNVFPHDTENTVTEFYSPSELLYHKDPKWTRNVRLKVVAEGGKVYNTGQGKGFRDIVNHIKEQNQNHKT